MVTYEVSSDLFPEAPCRSRVDSASPEDPLLQGGKLALGTSVDAENLDDPWDSELFLPGTFVIESRLKVISGQSSTAVRTPVSIGMTMSLLVGNALFVGQDEIFLLASNAVKGASAVLDTDDQVHTFRIEVTGTSAGSAVEVSYDAETPPRLQDVLIQDPAGHTSTPRLFFGEASVLAHGTAELESVSHNAGPVTCCGQANSCAKDEDLSSESIAGGGPTRRAAARTGTCSSTACPRHRVPDS